jgi:hypothetical protein
MTTHLLEYDPAVTPSIPLAEIEKAGPGVVYEVVNGQADLIAAFVGQGRFVGLSPTGGIPNEVHLRPDMHKEAADHGDLRVLAVIDADPLLIDDPLETFNSLFAILIKHYEEIVAAKLPTVSGLTAEQAAERLEFYKKYKQEHNL